MIDDIMLPEPRPRSKSKQAGPAKPATKEPFLKAVEAEEASFKTPEEAAAKGPSPMLPMVVNEHPQPKPPTGRFKRLLHWRPSRKQLIFGLPAVVLVVGAAAGLAYLHFKKPVAVVKPVKKSVVKKATPPPIIYSTLTGLPVPDASVNQRPVTGIMIENSLDARPQSGLGEAGVVFEAVAEGGVTRFLALFQDTAPANLGPIRSARPYYVSWAMGFDAAYAHVGGSAEALSDIINWGTKDMNQFYNGAYYHRTADRDAPHNVYTSMDQLNKLEAAKGYTSTYTGFVRGKAAPVSPATATSLDFHLSGPIYDPHYAYDASTNSYKRSEDGAPHIDANTNTQISPKVVIAMVVPLGQGALDASGAYYSDYNVLGSGQAFIFQNGTLIQATWNKAANNAPLTFTDAAGAAVPLVPGQTWISAVSTPANVKYQ